MATGTLADQVTYPSRIEPAERTPAVEARLQELLALVVAGAGLGAHRAAERGDQARAPRAERDRRRRAVRPRVHGDRRAEDLPPPDGRGRPGR